MRMVTLLVIILGLAGCVAAEDDFVVAEDGTTGPETARLAAIDWSEAEVVTISLSEFEFSPDALTFQEGTPYRLRLHNSGNVTHFFVSEGFFRAIVVEKLQTAEGDIERPVIKSIFVAPSTDKELWFVPVAEGEYDVECTAPLHSLFGMVGQIRIDSQG